MADERNIKGLAELNKVLLTLPEKLQKNVMRGALRAGISVVKPVAKANIHSVSGELAKGLKVGTRSRGTTVTANLKAKGPHGFVAKWVEYGTAAHAIVAKLGGSLFLGGLFLKSVNHPGARPKPFLRPALDSQATAAVVAAAEYMKARLASKHSLDTSHVVIEGDE